MAQAIVNPAAGVHATKMDAVHALKLLGGFIGRSQLEAIGHACRGEEKQFFFDKLTALGQLVLKMPRTYDQDGLGDQAIVSLHYFKGACDWYITEHDSDPDGKGQIQAFGYANLGDDECAELGYISIVELIGAGVELDLYFTPCTLGSIKAKAERAAA
ncbi:MAG: DUF2958 domain-containing protein [Betaproteobacteria bacterium]|nr:DUF2958 domain-containing protein [Betaproteobacteria bacterium]